MTKSQQIFRRFALAAHAAPLALGVALSATPSYGQALPAPEQPGAAAQNLSAAAVSTGSASSDGEIVVTGSRINRPDLVASSPVAVLSGEAFKVQNAVTVEALLNANPQFVPSGTANSNNPGDGAATIDLRGLGDNRTLVLIDGKRAPTYDVTGAVDVNGIPTALIKRVDVLTGGASAVYGSDAVAGVVNFILDDRFVGLRFDGSSQITQRGDGALNDVSLTAGTKIGDHGNFVVSGNYSKRDGVKLSRRSRLATSLDSEDFTPTGSSNTTPTAFDIPGGGRQQLSDAAGNLADYYQPYNTNPVNYAFIPLERYGATALGRFELTDNIEAYGRANYQHIKSITTLAPTATAGFPFNISPDNPFLSAAQQAAFFDTAANPDLIINPDGTSTIGIRRRITETGGRIESHKTETFQFVGGVRGDISSDFKFDVFGQYGRVKRKEILFNDISFTAITQSVDAIAGPNGPQCRDPSGGCAPTNLFTTNPLSAETLGFFIKNARQNNTITQIVAGGNISGDLSFLQSPAANHPAAISVGVEYRKEKGVQTVDPTYQAGDLIYYGQGQNAKGSYDAKEAYFELKMPLIQDRPFFRALNVEAGYRYSKYSSVGGVHTYKAGGDWSPIEGMRFRGIYQRAVRAPNLYELYSTQAAGTGNLNTDPCAGPGISQQVAAICIAQGARPNSIGSIPEPILGQINIFQTGNRNLDAEKSDTFTVGVVVNPPQLRAFSASIDYYHVKIANAIDTQASGQTIDQCFNVDLDPNSFACSGIKRNPIDGSLSGLIIYGVPEPYANLNRISTNGIDVSAGYHGGSADRFNYAVSFSGTYVRSFKKAGDQCAGLFGDICGYQPLPKWKHTADLNLGFGGINLVTRWRMIGKVHGDADMVGIARFRIKAFNYFDETLSFDINENFQLRLGMENTFDKKPPIVGDTLGAIGELGNTFPDVYDVLGRTFFAAVSAKF